MKLIKLTQEKFAQVDDEDFQKCSEYKWFTVKGTQTYYAARTLRRVKGKTKKQYLHHFILNLSTGVDHKNSNGLDCQKHNLRQATKAENNRNRSKTPNLSSKYKGVSLHKQSNRFMAKVAVNSKNIYLGSFNSEIEAAKAYDKVAKIYHGEFAKLNFNDGAT